MGLLNVITAVETNSDFPLVLKIIGIALFALSFVAAWNHIPVLLRVLMVIGLAMFFVGLKFYKIYSKT